MFTDIPPTTIFDGIVGLVAQATDEDIVTLFTGGKNEKKKLLAEKFVDLVLNDDKFRKRLLVLLGQEGSEEWLKDQAGKVLALKKIYVLAKAAYWWINSSFPPEVEFDDLNIKL